MIEKAEDPSVLEEIVAAFKNVFPGERVHDVEYDPQPHGVIFAIRSQIISTGQAEQIYMMRRYLLPLGGNFENVIRQTPQLDVKE